MRGRVVGRPVEQADDFLPVQRLGQPPDAQMAHGSFTSAAVGMPRCGDGTRGRRLASPGQHDLLVPRVAYIGAGSDPVGPAQHAAPHNERVPLAA